MDKYIVGKYTCINGETIKDYMCEENDKIVFKRGKDPLTFESVEQTIKFIDFYKNDIRECVGQWQELKILKVVYEEVCNYYVPR